MTQPSAKPVCPAHAVHVAPSAHSACPVSRRNAHAASAADLAQAQRVRRQSLHGSVMVCYARETPHTDWLGRESMLWAPQLCIRLRGTCSAARPLMQAALYVLADHYSMRVMAPTSYCC